MSLANLFAIVCVTLVLAVPSAYATPGLAREIEEAVELLLASVRAETSAREAFERQVKAGTLGPQERRDYEVYLDRLARMVEENRARVMALSHEVDVGAAAPGGAPLEGEDPPTTEERLAALDADLDTSLTEFDELLLDEMERVRRQSEPPAEARTGASAPGGGAQGGRSGQQGGGGAESTASEQGETGSGGEAGADDGNVAGNTGTGAESGAAGGTESGDGGDTAGSGVSTGRGSGGGTPTDIADASDDDVVARQLREAAERETDPALKERLWEEYRRYKSGARAQGGGGR